MADSTELNTYENKGYMSSDVEDSNANQVVKKSDLEKSSIKGKFSNLSEDEAKEAKRGILRNVVVISFSFMLLFTAFQSMANLQSSINKVRKMSICSSVMCSFPLKVQDSRLQFCTRLACGSLSTKFRLAAPLYKARLS